MGAENAPRTSNVKRKTENADLGCRGSEGQAPESELGTTLGAETPANRNPSKPAEARTCHFDVLLRRSG